MMKELKKINFDILTEEEALKLINRINSIKEYNIKNNICGKILSIYDLDKNNSLSIKKYTVKYLLIYNYIMKYIKNKLNVEKSELPYYTYYYYKAIVEYIDLIDNLNIFDKNTINIIKEFLEINKKEEKEAESMYKLIITNSPSMSKYFDSLINTLIKISSTVYSDSNKKHVDKDDIKNLKNKIYKKLTYKLKKC